MKYNYIKPFKSGKKIGRLSRTVRVSGSVRVRDRVRGSARVRDRVRGSEG